MEYDPVYSPFHKLLMSGALQRLPKGQILHTFDDKSKLNVINRGYIKRYLITKEGDKSIQVIYGPNDILPTAPMYKTIFKKDIYRGPHFYFYESMTEVVLHSITQEQLEAALHNDPLIYKDVLFQAWVRLNSHLHHMEDRSLRAAKKRLAHQLSYFADRFGQKIAEGTMIMVPLTHQTLAEILDLARETVTNDLNRLQDKGLIKTGQHIIVYDIDQLRQEAH